MFRGAAEASGCAYRDAEGVFDGLKGSESRVAAPRPLIAGWKFAGQARA